MSRILLSGLFVVALVVLAVPAFAVDGVVLINQNTINSGLPGCPGRNPGKFPISICQPGSYKLSGNLVVTASFDGIDISSDDVTLDLNGFAISCNDPTSCGFDFSKLLPVISFGGITSFHNNTIITNGTIRGFIDGMGVALSGSGGLLSDLKLTDNYNGIAARGANVGVQAPVVGFVITRCSAIGNLVDGIAAAQSTVTASVANNNGHQGFDDSMGGSVFINNVANGNGVGLATSNDLYGGNNFNNNGTPVQNRGSVSQNNNSCNGVVC